MSTEMLPISTTLCDYFSMRYMYWRADGQNIG